MNGEKVCPHKIACHGIEKVYCIYEINKMLDSCEKYRQFEKEMDEDNK